MTGGRGLYTLQLRYEQDVVLARQTARDIAGLLGFDDRDRSRIATSVSEIARNAYRYAGQATIEFSVPLELPELVITIRDAGPGIDDVDAVLDGRYRSRTGMGLGILGTRRLMDRFEIRSRKGEGTTVVLAKRVAGRTGPFDNAALAAVTYELSRREPRDAYSEIQHQNQELMKALQELRDRQAELEELNRELEDTNRGVVALYAELDEKADSLQRANELKTRFLSNMSHEFRTPLNSILSLAKLLIDRVDGDLAAEQERQVQFIRRSAEDLSELVNDLLDIAKVEAGKIVVRPAPFEVADLFSGLRGMLRPLLMANSSILLTFVDPDRELTMRSDEGKISQILRNFISNALKYTEAGEVRVWAEPQGDRVRFCVSDTGIGIAPEDRERIFEEFVQIDTRLQGRIRGTGLGLPLSRRLAELLGGTIDVESELGVGSTFSVTIPIVYTGQTTVSSIAPPSRLADPTRLPVVVVEDSAETVFTYEKYLKGTGFQVLAATSVSDARAVIHEARPFAVVLDVLLQEESTWDLLVELKTGEATRDIPVLVVTVVDNQTKALGLGADGFSLKPVERAWLLRNLRQFARRRTTESVLVIDDDEVSRYVLHGLLADTRYEVLEARGGAEGLRRAREDRPAAIFLDLAMPDMDGRSVLREIRADPATSDIPVIVYTANPPPPEEREGLAGATAVITKDAGSRDEALSVIRSVLTQAPRGGGK